MSKPKQINDFERVLFELQKIEREISALKDFCISKIQDVDDRPRSRGLVDPRTGELFKVKK
jgi:hypothetical protein